MRSSSLRKPFGSSTAADVHGDAPDAGDALGDAKSAEGGRSRRTERGSFGATAGSTGVHRGGGEGLLPGYLDGAL